MKTTLIDCIVWYKLKIKTIKCTAKSMKSDSVTESHEGDSDDSGSRHVCIIAVFLLIRLLYLHIHSLDYLFRSIQILTVFVNFINLVTMSSLIIYCLLNSSLKSIFSHWCSHSKTTHLKRFYLFIIKQQQYQLHKIK